MGLGGWSKIKTFAMIGLSMLAVGVTSISTFAWFQINNTRTPSSTVQTNGMRTDAFVYQNDNGHSYDDAANKSPASDASGTLTFDHSQGQAATSYYICGFGSLWTGNYVASSGIQMYRNPNNPNDRGTYWKISFAEGDSFKIFNSEGSYLNPDYWYGYSSISSGCTLKGTNFVSSDSDTNIHVAVAGVYDIFVNIQNVISIQYHSDTRFSADTTNEIGYLIVGSGSDWAGSYDMGEGIPMTINKRSDNPGAKDLAMYAGLRLAVGDSFRVVDGSSSHDNPTYFPTDNADSNLAPRTSGAADTAYFSYSATSNNYTFTSKKTGYYCIYLNGSSCVNIQLWDGKATDGTTYYTRGKTPIGSPQTYSAYRGGLSGSKAQPKQLASTGNQTIYFKDATWWSNSGNNGNQTTYIYLWDEDYLYFVPNNDWKSDNARFAVYCNNGTWIDLVETSSGSGIYKCPFPSDNKIVFVRLNPNALANNWDNKWNQTPTGNGRITISKSNNKYTLNSSGYDGVGYSVAAQKNANWPGVAISRFLPASFSITSPNYYSCTYDGSFYSKAIFSRKNPEDSNVYVQTVDITLSDSGANNMYDISETSAAWAVDGKKVTGVWGTYSAPSDVELTFTATYGDSSDSSTVTISYDGTGTVPSFTNHYGYTTPTSWSNGSVTLNQGATVSYATASSYSPKTFTATYSAVGTSTYYLDLYDLKLGGEAGLNNNSPTFGVYVWNANGDHDYGQYGSSGFPASAITTNVLQNADSSAAGYDVNANDDYRYCFWTLTLPSDITNYIVYVGTDIGHTSWQSADLSTSNNLAILDRYEGVTYQNGCSGNVRTVTTKQYMDDTETTLYKYNIFDHLSWTVPGASDHEGHTFSKWYSNTSGTSGTQYTEGQPYQITSDITLYCLYNTESYRLSKQLKIYRDTALKTTEDAGTQSLTYNVATSVTAVSYAGATFVGWYSDAACTDPLSNKNDGSYKYTIGAAAATIYAKFTLNSATLTGTYTYLNSSGAVAETSQSSTTVYVEDSLSVVSNAIYNAATSANALSSGIEEGYFHEGWFDDAQMSSAWTAQTVAQSDVSGGIHLYAKLSTAKVYLLGSSEALGNWHAEDSSYSSACSSSVSFSVVLGKGDEFKTYSPRASEQVWFPNSESSPAAVTGSAKANGFVGVQTSGYFNIYAEFAGTYSVTLTMDSNLNVTAIAIAATALDPSDFGVSFGTNGLSASPTFTGSGTTFTVTFRACIGDTFKVMNDFDSASDTYVCPSITNSSSDDYQGLEIKDGYVRSAIDADITITVTVNLSTFGSSTYKVTRVQEYSIVYAAGEHAEFDTATYFIQAADNNTFTQGVSIATMHYPVDSTNYHAVYTGYTLSFSENKSVRYVRVLQRVSNATGSADSEYQKIFDIGGEYPLEYCTVNYDTDIYTFNQEGVFDIKVHKPVDKDSYLEVSLSQATAESETTHYSDVYIIGRGKPGSDIRDGDYTTDHGIRMHTYGGNTSVYPAYVGEVDYTSSTFAAAVSARTVGNAITLMSGDQFTLTDGVTTFGPASNGTGYTVSNGTVTISQSAEYYIWAESASSVTIAQKVSSTIDDGRTVDDRTIDGGEDWLYSPVSYTREYGARVLNASGSTLQFGGKLDYSLLDGCGDGYYHFYIELRNTSKSTSGAVTYGFSGLALPTGTRIKYKNAVQNNGSTLKSGFNANTLSQLDNETTLTNSTTITNSNVTANQNGFAGSTVVEVMIPISQIAVAATFDFAFAITVSYQETISA